MNKKALDIVLPCFNSQKDWYKQLLLFYDEFSGIYDLKFIIVNDGSTFNCLEEALEILKDRNIPFHVVSYSKNKGKGYALRQGVMVAEQEHVLYTDIDFPFTNQSMGFMIEQLLNSHSDVFAGIRDQAYYQKNMTSFRKYLSKAFRFILRRFLKMEISDTQCGLKAFNENGKKEFLSTTINRYLFDFEFIYICSKKSNIHIQPVSVELKENVVFSKMKLKVLFQEVFNLLKIIFFSKNQKAG